MCGRFTTLSWDELKQVAVAIEAETPINTMPDWPAESAGRRDVFPGSIVPVLAVDAESDSRTLEQREMDWGFGLHGKRDAAFNTRIENARNRFWVESFLRRHCIVAAQAFFEPSRDEMVRNDRGNMVKQVYRFARLDDEPILMAGIWRDDRFSILTTTPNKVVGSVHDRMPMIVDVKEARGWLIDGVVPNVAIYAGSLVAQGVH